MSVMLTEKKGKEEIANVVEEFEEESALMMFFMVSLVNRYFKAMVEKSMVICGTLIRGPVADETKRYGH